jgi:uncharacterized protein
MSTNVMMRMIQVTGCAILVWTAGCATSPRPSQYVFSSGEGWRTVASRDVENSEYIIRFAPVRLPAYLDRPQIVTRISDSQINADEFHRWGIPLDVTVKELLGAGVARALPEAYVDVLPSRSQNDSGYQILVDIVRLDGELGGPVELIAQWKVSREGDARATITQRLTRHQQETGAKTYEAYVEALRLCTAALSADIAGVIKKDVAEKSAK